MKIRLPIILFAAFFLAVAARAQTTIFTYQGQLSSSNAPVSGLYDFRFQLFDVNTNAVSVAITNAPVGVTNGEFTTQLNFGAAVFDGSDRWLQIAVRPYASGSNYTALSPLQQITSAPYAIRALNASNAVSAVSLVAPLSGTNITGIIPVVNLPTNVAFLNSNQTFTGANIFSNSVTATNAANTFAGFGSGLKNLTATNLVGIVPDTNLSANVALQSNPNLNFAGNVSATNFSGGGHGLTNVPGAFFWVTPAASLTASPNVGYIATNATTPLTVTLPTLPSIGDTYKVCGVGAGGWKIAQNSGQTILAGNLSENSGQNWTNSGAGTANWSSIACSADGTKLVAVAGDTLGNTGFIYTNDNSGIGTWTARDSARQWTSVASSANGTKLVAANYGSAGSGSPGIYISMDSGGSWTLRASGGGCVSVASSADGTKLAAALSGGFVDTSVDGGASWTTHSVSGDWTSVASSADGMELVAAITSGGQIYTSSNGGTNWTAHGISGNWAAVASSADGTRLIACQTSGNIYISTDSGNTWSPTSDNDSGAWSAATASADGSRLAAVYSQSSAGYIDISSDSGNSWQQQFAAGNLDWSGVTCSADGSLFAATVHGGGIYISSHASTTSGATGYLLGAQHSAIELIYVGNGNFLPLNHEGTIRAY